MKRMCILALSMGLIAFTSCKKEGCTDIDAVNYDVDAKKDDNTCMYQGENVIWYNQNTATELQNDGATALTYYVDGQIVGSSAASVYFTSKPDCGQNGSITVTGDLGMNKTGTASYEVIDQTGWTYWSGTLYFDANTCEAVELTW